MVWPAEAHRTKTLGSDLLQGALDTRFLTGDQLGRRLKVGRHFRENFGWVGLIVQRFGKAGIPHNVMRVDKADSGTPGAVVGLRRGHPGGELGGNAGVARIPLAGRTVGIGAGLTVKAIDFQVGAGFLT